MLADPNYFSEPYDWYTYRARGRYLEHLEPWLKLFDRDQFLFLISEEFYADPAGTYARVLEFLGLPPYRLANYRVYNDRRSAPLAPELREELTEYYRPYNAALAERLGLNLPW